MEKELGKVLVERKREQKKKLLKNAKKDIHKGTSYSRATLNVDRGFFNSVLDLFGSGGNEDKDDEASDNNDSLDINGRFKLPSHSQGLYLWGGVGCGKTFLMDIFYYVFPNESKRRVHFHSFMLDVHQRMHKVSTSGLGDPLPDIARELVHESRLICFDEFQVTDISDAMIMKRLFTYFFQAGGYIIATSNRPPVDLYKHGLQRELFVPFIHTLEERSHVHDMASATDYRLTHFKKEVGVDRGEHSVEQTYFLKKNHASTTNDAKTTSDAKTTNSTNDANSTASEGASKKYANLFQTLTKGKDVQPATLETQGRKIHVPEAVVDTQVCRFTYAGLCKANAGSADYIAIASHFHTVFISNVPQMDLNNEANEVRRFITLIDALYEHHCKVVILADESPAHLLKRAGEKRDDEGENEEQKNGQKDPNSFSTSLNERGDLLGEAKYVPSVKDEAFAFDRTVSRLLEMQTKTYLRLSHANTDSEEQRNKKLRAVSSSNVSTSSDASSTTSTTTSSTTTSFEKKKSPLQKRELVREVTISFQRIDLENVDTLWENYDVNKNGVIERAQ